MKRKLKWRVADRPIGLYRSFEKRQWPIAEWREHSMIDLLCEDEYVPANIKEGRHRQITIRVAMRPLGLGNPFTWKLLKKRAATLKEAKELAQDIFDRHPEYFGLEEKSE